MRNLLYILAVIIVVAWAIGFIGYHAGGIIHILLVIALISVLLGIIQGKRVRWNFRFCGKNRFLSAQKPF